MVPEMFSLGELLKPRKLSVVGLAAYFVCSGQVQAKKSLEILDLVEFQSTGPKMARKLYSLAQSILKRVLYQQAYCIHTQDLIPDDGPR